MKIHVVKEDKSFIAEASSKRNPGAMIVAVNMTDVIGPEITKLVGHKINFPFPTGHAYGAVITPINASQGRVTAFTFGPPICKKSDKNVDLITQALKKNPLPIFTSMTVKVRNAGRCPLKNFFLTQKGAKRAAKGIKRAFKQSDMNYAVFNSVNPEAALSSVGSNGRCKAYSVVPIGFAVGEMDADNCATFVVDALSAGRGGFGTIGFFSLLTSPKLIVGALSSVADFTGRIT